MSRLAVAAVATIVLLLGVTEGVGLGSPDTIQGGSPSQVITNTEPQVCGESVGVNGGPSLMKTDVVLGEDSDLLLYFTAEFSGIDPRTELLLSFVVFDEVGLQVSTPFEWGFVGNEIIRSHSTASVMWSFGDVPADDYDVYVDARVDPPPGPLGGGHPSATLENCALTAFVIPAE